ncbi:MAG: VWA domain-containing protein [Bacteroidetes bacterium]|nr:VWA domain-containing protein [Bacteroidota bacterium]
MTGVYEHFFDVMEDLGFFEHIYEDLPEDFTAVFEIARILEDETHTLTQKLMPVLALQSSGGERREEQWTGDPQMYVDEREEYEAGLIRSPQHLPRIYNYQWLLPEEVFFRRLAKKELWVPYAREPTYFRIDPEADDYQPDSRKQKLYVLLDTSSSMAMKNRINLAKAVVYYFLKRNMRELGYIHLRTFDTKIGDLHEAKDTDSFHALIRYVMRLHTLGNGTAMARAIRQAVDDITALPQLSGTEILIITDGACALDEAYIRAMLGERIVINTIKIGRSQLYASKSYIHDRLFEEDTEQHRILGRLQKRAAEMAYQKEHAQSPHLRRRYEESHRALQQEIDRQVNAMTEEIIVGYGHELERLSQLYLQVDDIDLPGLFELGEEQHQEISDLFRQICEELDYQCSLERLRKLALLLDHLSVLMKNTDDADLRARFEELQKQIAERLTGCIEEQLHQSGGGVLRSLTTADRHDLEFLISSTSSLHINLWRAFIWKLLRGIRRLRGRD